jgi:GTP-binding protein
MGHKAVVVINKIDRKDAEPARVLNETFDLFIELGATEEQADFPVIYAQATAGRAGLSPEVGPDLGPLFDAILRHVPAPKVDSDAPLQLLVTMLGYDDYRGVTAIGRIFAGRIKAGQRLARLTTDGRNLPESAKYLYTFRGLNKIEIEEASAGDIVSLAGLEGIAIGETLADPNNPIALPTIKVEEPTVRMTFGVNTSPFAGKEASGGPPAICASASSTSCEPTSPCAWKRPNRLRTFSYQGAASYTWEFLSKRCGARAMNSRSQGRK